MRHAHRHHALDQVAGLGAVVVIIFQRIFDRFRHHDRSGKMHDRFHVMIAQSLLHQWLVGNIAPNEGHIVRHRPTKTRHQIVDHDDAITSIAQRQHCMASNITGTTRDQNRRLFAHKRHVSRKCRARPNALSERLTAFRVALRDHLNERRDRGARLPPPNPRSS